MRISPRIGFVLASLFTLASPLAWRSAHADPPVAQPAVPPADAGADTPASSDASAAPEVTCNEQPADASLIRRNYIPIGGTSEDVRRRRDAHLAAIRFRTEHYGYFEGFGAADSNPHTPLFYAEATHFMGLPVRVHRAIVPVLHCVERDIAARCADTPYHPRHLEGLRTANSFNGGEVSNHVYGIAVDVDPQRNPCCGCGTMYAHHPGCTRQANSVWERMEMPSCWVQSFERYGFYWLGNDHQLRDLMHFEFLGDPDRIVRR